MLRFYISLVLSGMLLSASAQIKKHYELPVKEQNKLIERQFFIRLGVDLSRFALNYMNDIGHTGFEMSMDTELKYRYFPTLELGTNKIEYSQSDIEYHSQGNYLRLGLNYNMLNYKQRFDRNLFFIGARLGMSTFNQEIPQVIISNPWGEYQNSFPLENYSAQWFEGVIGLRGEVLPNLYLGYTLRVKQMLNHTAYNKLTPYWIPGYGKGFQSRALGMSYSIFYAIPIKKIKPELVK